MLFRISVLALLLVAACNGGGDETPDSTDGATAQTLEEQLESILLKDEEVPEGLEGADLAFSTNEQVAGPDEEELRRLNATGRILGVDISYVPVRDLPAESPARGGIQNSASVYVDTSGAQAAFDTRSNLAATNDWPANYTDLTDVQAGQLDRLIGDETYWLRVTGLDKCEEPTPGPDGSPAPTCPPARLAVIDHVLVRSGRTFIYVMVASDTAQGAPEDVFVSEIEGWAAAVAQRAAETFPTAAG